MKNYGIRSSIIEYYKANRPRFSSSKGADEWYLPAQRWRSDLAQRL